MLGLSGQVDEADFHALVDNVNPASGERLTARTKSNRTIGYDFTFNAPKSVSVAWAMTGDERIVATFRKAVADTMAELEDEAKTRVRTKGRTDAERTTGNLAWAEFVHFTSRPVNGVEDPHLHAHCYTFNATHDEAEGRWKAGQFRDLKRDAPYWEAAFHARLSKGLAEQGFAIERGSKSWEIAGFEPETLTKFSRRTAQIEAKAKELGITYTDDKAALGAKHRENKREGVTRQQLQSEWTARMSGDELDAVANLRTVRSDQPAVTPKQAVDYALNHCLETKSVAPEKEVLRVALRRGAGSLDAEAVKNHFRGRGRDDVVVRSVAGRRMVTTAEILKEEKDMLDFARSGRGAAVELAPDAEIKVGFLNDGQRDAIRHVWTSRDRVTSILGGAGSGKTTLLQEVVRGLEEKGLGVRAFAQSADASRGVLRSEGFKHADTIYNLLQNEKHHDAIRNGVIVIDEAGLVDSRTMGEVFDLAKEQNARVLLVGDTRQHQSVARGDAMRLLRDEAGIVPAEVTEIMRQTGSYKDAVKAISDGDTAQGFAVLDQLDAIEEVGNDVRHERLAGDYCSAINAGKSALVVSPTRAEGQRVTDEIRGRLKRTGKLMQDEKTIKRLDDRRLSTPQKQDQAQYQVGDVVVFHKAARNYRRGESVPLHSMQGKPLATVDLPERGIKHGERFRVVGVGKNVMVEDAAGRVTPLPLKEAERFNVFAERDLGVSIGDRLRITGNGKAVDGKQRLNNGDLATVAGFTKDGNLRIIRDQDAKKKTETVMAGNYGQLTHGYCTTSHASQGKTVQRVFVAQGSESFVASSAEQFYVSVSRGKEQVKIYTDDKAELMDAVKRSGQRVSATELMHQARGGEIMELNRADRLKAWALRTTTNAAEAMRSTVANTRKLWQDRSNIEQINPGMRRT